MKQVPTIAQPTFDLPHYTPGALDYMARAHTEEMYAFVHLFRQQCRLFGLPETNVCSQQFLLEEAPIWKDRQRQQEKGQHLLDELLGWFTDALTKAGWTQIGVSPNNGKTPIWQPPYMYHEDGCLLMQRAINPERIRHERRTR